MLWADRHVLWFVQYCSQLLFCGLVQVLPHKRMGAPLHSPPMLLLQVLYCCLVNGSRF